MLSAASISASSAMKCSNIFHCRRGSAKPSSGASISTRRACATSHEARHRSVRLARRLHRLRTGRSGLRTRPSKTHHSYGPRHAAYDLKKLRGKQIVRRIGQTRRYEPIPSGLRAITALLVLRDKAIKPLLAAAQPSPPSRGGTKPTTDRSPLRCHPSSPCKASSMNSGSPPDHRQFFCGASPRSA